MAVELVTLFVVPVVFCGYKEFALVAGLNNRDADRTEALPALEQMQEPEPEAVFAG
jgi:hypothetical protein